MQYQPMRHPIFFLALLSASLCSCQQAVHEDFILAHGYVGPVEVIFDSDDGKDIEMQNDRRVYRIPAEGVLHTKFEPVRGLRVQKYYYSRISGDTEIPATVYFEGINPLDTVVFACETSNPAGVKDTGRGSLKFNFIVGPPAKADSLIQVRQRRFLQRLSR